MTDVEKPQSRKGTTNEKDLLYEQMSDEERDMAENASKSDDPTSKRTRHVDANYGQYFDEDEKRTEMMNEEEYVPEENVEADNKEDEELEGEVDEDLIDESEFGSGEEGNEEDEEDLLREEEGDEAEANKSY